MQINIVDYSLKAHQLNVFNQIHIGVVMKGGCGIPLMGGF